jgi:hypothetical protein
MIAPLRKRHRIIWRIFAPLLFIGAISAYVMAPKFPIDSFSENNVNFPELLRSVVSENYMFNLKKDYSGGNVVEVIQISNINPVSELVSINYPKPGSKSSIEKELGMMGGNTKYVFNLGTIEPPFSITVKDTIKDQTLASIDF